MATFGPYTDAIIATAGIRNYWKLNENSGVVANAAVGAEAGAYVASPTLGVPALLGSDPRDRAFSTAPASSYMGVNTHTAVCTGRTAAFSIEIWMASTSTLLNVFAIGETSGSSTNPVASIGFDQFAPAGRPRMFFRSDTGVALGSTASPDAINDGLAHHLVLTSDGTTMRLYVDGIEKANATIPASGVVTLNRFGIGCLNRTTAGSFLPGTFDEAALYNQALSVATIRNHLALGRSAGVLL